jgi:hypothetical protein
MSNTITVSKSSARLTLSAGIGALLGLLLGWVIFSHSVLAPSTVPPAALQLAYTAGSEILQGSDPDSLPMDVFTRPFLDRYQTDYPVFLHAMATSDISWTGTPVVTWTGDHYLDVCLIALTQAGTMAVELRLVRNGNAWSVDRLLSLQLREAR